MTSKKKKNNMHKKTKLVKLFKNQYCLSKIKSLKVQFLLHFELMSILNSYQRQSVLFSQH